jgi:hypothetical protein
MWSIGGFMVYPPIIDRADLERIVASSRGGPYYVYLLRKPDGEPKFGGIGTPFYVGIGRGLRLFDHEKEACDLSRLSIKL